MLQLHVAGRLVRSPEAKTSKNGKNYVQGLLLVPAGDADIFVTLMAFDPDLQAVLTGLKKGDSLSAGGSGSIRAYLDKEGQPAAGVSLMLNRLMAMTEAKATAKLKRDPAANSVYQPPASYSTEPLDAAELPPVEAYERTPF